MGCATCVLGVLGFLIDLNGSNDVYGNAFIAFTCFYVFFTNPWDVLGWVIPAEVYQANLRAKGVALASSMNWLAAFTITKTTPGLLLSVSEGGFGIGGTFMFFAGWGFLAWVWAVFNIHETKNMSLENMDAIFDVVGWSEYSHYAMMNLRYCFYFGPKTMFEFTHGVDGDNNEGTINRKNKAHIVDVQVVESVPDHV